MEYHSALKKRKCQTESHLYMGSETDTHRSRESWWLPGAGEMRRWGCVG